MVTPPMANPPIDSHRDGPQHLGNRPMAKSSPPSSRIPSKLDHDVALRLAQSLPLTDADNLT
jgi:hypothetical protein